MLTHIQIASLERLVRQRGGVLFVDTDGRLMIYPASVKSRFPIMATMIANAARQMKDYLLSLAR
jgi:hypothetical protein